MIGEWEIRIEDARDDKFQFVILDPVGQVAATSPGREGFPSTELARAAAGRLLTAYCGRQVTEERRLRIATREQAVRNVTALREQLYAERDSRRAADICFVIMAAVASVTSVVAVAGFWLELWPGLVEVISR